MINVTKTYLPPLEDYTGYLKKIWEKGQITNHGPMELELEAKLKKYLGAKHVFFVTNGTVALQLAIKALGLKDEIITTPFSYVATTSSIFWEGCKPIFADINLETLTIDPAEIEKKITPKTTAILATHVYGNPCEVEKIEAIAKNHNLKVIYDAAHAFGVEYKGKGLVNYGDISTLSFHATKLFHTVEGGAVVTNDDDLAFKISYMRNFGHKGQEEFWGLGINGKNSEIHAAMGLAIFPRIEELISRREALSKIYDGLISGTILRRPKILENTKYNFAYYPVIFSSEQSLLKAREELNKADIFPRRYFYPSLNHLGYVGEQEVSVSEEISKKVLCLPLYFELRESEVHTISEIIKRNA